jgi:hypothetical protein
MSDDENNSNEDAGKVTAPASFGRMRMVDLEDFQNLVSALSGTFEGARENSANLQELSTAFMQLERGCTAMYQVIMQQRDTMADLEKRINILEKKLNASE